MIIHLFNSSSVSGLNDWSFPPIGHAGPIHDRQSFGGENLFLEPNGPLGEYSRSLGLVYESVPVAGRWDRTAMNRLRSLLDRVSPPSSMPMTSKPRCICSGRGGDGHFPSFPPTTECTEDPIGKHGCMNGSTGGFPGVFRPGPVRLQRRPCLPIELGTGRRPAPTSLERSGRSSDRFRAPSRGIQEISIGWLPNSTDRDGLFLLASLGVYRWKKAMPACSEPYRCWIKLPAGLAMPGFRSGPLEDKLRRQVRILGLENRIVWMGYRKEAGSELAGLDILLSFSKAEGLPISLIEAGWRERRSWPRASAG